MASTYTPIATTSVGTATSIVTFSSIPSTYTDLVLQAVMLQDGTATSTNGFIRLNSSNTGYSKTGLSGSGTSATSYRQSNADRLYTSVDATATDWAFSTWHFMNYSNTSTYKTILTRQNSTSGGIVNATIYLWQNTAAINQIEVVASDFFTTPDKFVSGSTFTLYGIAAA